MKTIMIVDDHDLIRYAIRNLITDKCPGTFEVIAEANNGYDAVQLARTHAPDVAIIDIALPQLNGIEVSRKIHKTYPKTKILVLSMYKRQQYLRDLIQIGISGYVLKTSIVSELLRALEAILEGGTYLSPEVSHLITEDYATLLKDGSTLQNSCLTPRQREVLQLIAEGNETKQIARLLKITPKGVESLRFRIMQKLEIYSVADLVKYAIREGLVNFDY